MTNTNPRQTPIEADDEMFNFPCDIPIKVMGRAVDDFKSLAVSLVRKHCEDPQESEVITRLSNRGKYMSVTIKIKVKNRQHLDNILLELTSNPRVLFVL